MGLLRSLDRPLVSFLTGFEILLNWIFNVLPLCTWSVYKVYSFISYGGGGGNGRGGLKYALPPLQNF